MVRLRVEECARESYTAYAQVQKRLNGKEKVNVDETLVNFFKRKNRAFANLHSPAAPLTNCDECVHEDDIYI